MHAAGEGRNEGECLVVLIREEREGGREEEEVGCLNQFWPPTFSQRGFPNSNA